MTTYRKRTDGTLVEGLEAFKALYPNTSFPKPITNDIITSYGFDEVSEGSHPSITPPYEYVESDGIKEVSGIWTQTYKVATYDSDTKTAIDTETADSGRSRRTTLLEETDWAGGSDLTMSDDMKTYRQALRDGPTQAGFPHTITWPTKPS